jgi:hypothetical protein
MHECEGESSTCLLEGMSPPIALPEGRDFDSFSLDLKQDYDNLSMQPSKSQKGTSLGSLSISSGWDPYFLRPHSSIHNLVLSVFFWGLMCLRR